MRSRNVSPGTAYFANPSSKCCELRQYVAEGVPAEDEPTTLALRLIDEVGCGRPASLFLALHTVSEHLKEMA